MYNKITLFLLFLVALTLGFVPNRTFGAVFAGTNTGAIPDGTGNNVCGAARDVNFAVSGVTGPAMIRAVGFTMTHTWAGDIRVTLIAPNATQFLLFSDIGKQNLAADAGEDSDFGGTYVFQDAATQNIWTAATLVAGNVAIPPGSYRTQGPGPFANDSPGPAFTTISPAFIGVPNPNGTWILRFQDCYGSDTGTVTAASLTITGPSAAPASIQGRVLGADGRGIPRALITLIDPRLGNQTTAITNPLGYFYFSGIESGQGYVLTVAAKNHTFDPSSRAIDLNDNIVGLDFVADPDHPHSVLVDHSATLTGSVLSSQKLSDP